MISTFSVPSGLRMSTWEPDFSFPFLNRFVLRLVTELIASNDAMYNLPDTSYRVLKLRSLGSDGAAHWFSSSNKSGINYLTDTSDTPKGNPHYPLTTSVDKMSLVSYLVLSIVSLSRAGLHIRQSISSTRLSPLPVPRPRPMTSPSISSRLCWFW